MNHRLDALVPQPPRREYMSNATFSKLKGQLTRAERSGDPVKVLAAVESFLKACEGTVMPDDWARWLRALEDAFREYQRTHDGWNGEEVGIIHRFQRCYADLAW